MAGRVVDMAAQYKPPGPAFPTSPTAAAATIAATAAVVARSGSSDRPQIKMSKTMQYHKIIVKMLF